MASKSVTARTKGSVRPSSKKTAPKTAPAARPAAKTAKTAARSRPAAKATARPAVRSTPKSESPRNRAKAPSSDFSLDKLHQIALQATNLDAAVSFYRDVLGLKLLSRLDQAGFAFFDMGGFRLVLSATASKATLYFRVVDIDSAVKTLRKKSVSFLSPPTLAHRDDAGEFGKKGTEEWVAFFKDPSGNVLALAERR